MILFATGETAMQLVGFLDESRGLLLPTAKGSPFFYNIHHHAFGLQKYEKKLKLWFLLFKKVNKSVFSSLSRKNKVPLQAEFKYY
jgi:hypothetical protein